MLFSSLRGGQSQAVALGVLVFGAAVCMPLALYLVSTVFPGTLTVSVGAMLYAIPLAVSALALWMLNGSGNRQGNADGRGADAHDAGSGGAAVGTGAGAEMGGQAGDEEDAYVHCGCVRLMREETEGSLVAWFPIAVRGERREGVAGAVLDVSEEFVEMRLRLVRVQGEGVDTEVAVREVLEPLLVEGWELEVLFGREEIAGRTGLAGAIHCRAMREGEMPTLVRQVHDLLAANATQKSSAAVDEMPNARNGDATTASEPGNKTKAE